MLAHFVALAWMAMFDLSELMNALPVSGLEPQLLAFVDGLVDVPESQQWQESVRLLEPPASMRVAYVDPLQVLEKLLRHNGAAPDRARAASREMVLQLKGDVKHRHWVNFFDSFDPGAAECLPLPTLMTWLSAERLVSSHAIDFLSDAAHSAVTAPMFRGPDDWNDLLSLLDLPTTPPPKAMIEFVPGAPWGPEFNWGPESNPFLIWREQIRPIAETLERALGEPVYYFRNLQDELDDDAVHRFLVLHWCCTYKPESPFVRYIIARSGAADVEQLKRALVDPVNYVHPFVMNNAFVGLEATTLHLRLGP
jgi:hypothetical protein